MACQTRKRYVAVAVAVAAEGVVSRVCEFELALPRIRFVSSLLLRHPVERQSWRKEEEEDDDAHIQEKQQNDAT